MLQLASAEAENMAALGFNELLQAWGRGTIRKRFHELSMQVHPDKCSLPNADQARALQPSIATKEADGMSAPSSSPL